jgi:REP element-mobilizing transposase RayT
MPRLQAYARSIMRGDPILLDIDKAKALLEQFRETATYRGWTLLAVAILATHIHLIVGVSGDPDPTTLTRDFKAYGSRRLNKSWGKPASETWWVESGSERILNSDASLEAAVFYVLVQRVIINRT